MMTTLVGTRDNVRFTVKLTITGLQAAGFGAETCLHPPLAPFHSTGNLTQINNTNL